MRSCRIACGGAVFRSLYQQRNLRILVTSPGKDAAFTLGLGAVEQVGHSERQGLDRRRPDQGDYQK